MASLIATNTRAAVITSDPDLVYLGSFSGGDAVDDELVPATTELQIDSADDWSLELRLVDWPHRVDDAAGLPLEPGRPTPRTIPRELLDGEAVVPMRGTGSPRPQVATVDWRFLQTALQGYIQPEDPAGDYEATLSGRLLGANGGSPLSDPATLALVFEIRPWLGIADDLPDIHLNVYDLLGAGESEAMTIPILGNCGWTLSVTATSDLVREDGLSVIPAGSLAVAVPENGGSGEWTPLRHGWTPLHDRLPVARGPGLSGALRSRPGVPMLMAFKAEPSPPAGTYHMTLSLSVASDLGSEP
jgi:hypothetical protein